MPSKPIMFPRSHVMHGSDKSGLAGATLPVRALFNLILTYKALISPLFTGCCRFVPSCSSYAQEALIKHGAVKGSWLTVYRLVRCHPLCSGGLDQVPEPERAVLP